MDLVSPNIRGAVLEVAEFVSPYHAVMSWKRHGFPNSDYDNLPTLQRNAAFYSPLDICASFSRNVDWCNAKEAERGLRALSEFIRYAEVDDWEDEVAFQRALEHVRVACIEDGFDFSEQPYTIRQNAGAVQLTELDLKGLKHISGINETIKKLNRAIVGDRDNAEVIGYSKDLMEAVADAILLEKGYEGSVVRNMKAQERCSEVMKSLDIVVDDGRGKVARGLSDIRKAMNLITDGVVTMRREDTDEGHGSAVRRVVKDSHASLALSAALLWSEYILETFREENVAPF